MARTLKTKTETNALVYRDRGGKIKVRPEVRDEARRAVISYLDVATTATGRGTFYNTKEEQEAAEAAVHEAVWGLNRGLYSLMALLPGASDRTIQKSAQRLLDNPRTEEEGSILSAEQEGKLLAMLVSSLPPHRMVNMFVSFAEARVNNARTRKLILRSILGDPDRLALWAVKYRSKLKTALRHALTTGVCYGLAELTTAKTPSRHGRAALAKYIDPYIPHGSKKLVYECLAFILGGPNSLPKLGRAYTVPILNAFIEAQADLTKGGQLPMEVLEGIRSKHHKEIPHARVLELVNAAGTMTDRQKLKVQKSADKAGVKIDFNPASADLVSLYVYALETGKMDAALRRAMDKKAEQIARTFPFRYEKVSIVVDCSGSMFGTEQAKNRPMAVSLAMRDVIANTATQASVEHTGEVDGFGLASPSGDTSLAEYLVAALESEPDAVFLLTDGYENAPAGRVDEILNIARELGVETPVYQITPVMAAEKASIRTLSSKVSAMPVTRPEALGMSAMRAALEQDVQAGITCLVSTTMPLLEKK